LKWETQTAYGAGIDFTVLKGPFNGTLDYFNKSQKDLLFYRIWRSRRQIQGIGLTYLVTLEIQGLRLA
jgi:hypothetical protein